MNGVEARGAIAGVREKDRQLSRLNRRQGEERKKEQGTGHWEQAVDVQP